MRILLLASLLVAALSSNANAQEGGGRPFGLGLVLGEPTGITAKLYLGGKPFALLFGLGWIDDRGFGDDDDDGLHLHVDAVWHPAILTRNSTFVMPFYVGVGGRLLEDDNDHYHHCHGGDCYGYDNDTHAGVRIPLGILMAFHKAPIDAFLEVAPTIDFLYDDDDFCHDGHCHGDFEDDRLSLYVTLGARYYF